MRGPPCGCPSLLLLCAAAACAVRHTRAAKGQARQKFKLDIPRVNEESLRANQTLRTGHHPFVLTGFASAKWAALNWTLDSLVKQIPFEWVDFYPENMDNTEKRPFLYRLDEAMPKFRQRSEKPKYMQMRIGMRGWKRLRKDFEPKPVPEVFWDDDEWAHACMVGPGGKPDKKAIDNFFVTQQWKFLLIGEKGTTMFFHQDGTAASSWQAQLIGRKKWTLCPNSESGFLNPKMDSHDPATWHLAPNFGKALCGQVTVEPGEIVYYPGYWWHQALQLDTPTVAYTGALVGVEADRPDLGGSRKPHDRFYQDIQRMCQKCWDKNRPDRLCEDISEKWPGAAPPVMRTLCENYLPECYKAWDAHARNLHSRRSEL